MSPYKRHREFKNLKDKNRKIWRYINVLKLLSLLDKQNLFFVRADKLDDPFEGLYPQTKLYVDNSIKKSPIKFTNNLSSLQDAYKKLIKERKKERRNTYINCWHMNDYESAAMWNIYSSLDEGIAIQSTFNKLTNSFNVCNANVYVGLVKYIDYTADLIPLVNVYSPYLYKRTSFEFEKEIRAVINGRSLSLLNNHDINVTKNGIYVPVDLEILIEVIYVSPKFPVWVFQLLESILDKYGINKPIIQSKLYREPLY